TLDGLSFELAGTAQVSLERSLVRSSGTLMTVFDDDARGRIEDSDIQGTPVLGLVQGGNLDVLGSVLRQGTGYTVSGGQLSIRDSRFENVSNVVVVTALGAPSRVVELVDTRIELFDGPNNVLVQQFGGEVLLDGVTIQAPALGASYAIDVVAGDLEVAGLDVEARQAIHVASPGTVHGASAVVDGRMEVAGELDLAGVRGGEQTVLVADGGVIRLSGFDLREVTGPPSPALAWGRVLNGGFMELEGSVLEGGAVGLRVESGQVSLIDSTVDTSGNALVVTPGVGVGALAFVEGSTVASSGFARAVELDGGGLVAERSVFLSRASSSTVHVTSDGEAWLARSTVLKQGADLVGAVTLEGDAGLYATGSILWSDAPGVDTVVCSG
ncbi:MAG: hypothetical protein KC656_34185, partial [Myxococcales bacterium]|nr:hypothetical protein [Myxococcales bacterium]